MKTIHVKLLQYMALIFVLFLVSCGGGRIYLSLGLPDSKLDCEHSNPNGFKRVRGFFVNPLGDFASV